MTPDDRTLAIFKDWLEHQPDRAPQQLLEQVVTDLQAAPQRAVWQRALRSYAMSASNTLRYAIVLAAAALAVGVGYWVWSGQLSTEPAAQPTAPTVTTPSPPLKFTSPLYGYSVQAPPNWIITPATSRWSGASTPHTDPSEVDLFRDGEQPQARSATLRAQTLASDLTAATWLEDWKQIESADIGGRCFGKSMSWEARTIAGVTAWSFSWRCDNSARDDANYDEYAFVVGGQGYVVHGAPALVEALVASFDGR